MSSSTRNMRYVFMAEESEIIDANEFLDNCEEDEFFKLRTRIEKHRRSNPIALCSECFQPVVLRANSNRTTFFAHVKDSEDCPIKTTSHLTQDEILALKYNGQKEGKLHRENKATISNLIIQDSLFSNEVKVEKTFREKHPVGIAKQWRRPDITATLLQNHREVVFELQVTTTFLDVIIKREEFYKKNSAYITWVFLDFDHEKFTLLDIAYANKANVFVFDEMAKSKSIDEGKLILNCYYRKPYMTENLTLDYSWTSKLIDFSELYFDEDDKKPYLVDTERLKSDVLNQISNAKIRIKQEQEETERIALEAKRLEILEEHERSQRFEQLRKSYTHFQAPKNYPNKAHRNTNITAPISRKSYGDSHVCRVCTNIGKPRKMGRLNVCNRCGHEIT